MMTELATFGGGCFWCLEAVYEQVRGVREVVSGYAGGHVPDPTYEQVCSGTTGHAEVVQLRFDPGEVTYRELVEIFFTIHDPTTPDRQGADVGTQYRSILFFHSPEQQRTAGEVIARLEADQVFADPIVTRVEPAGEFHAAEPYHQQYYRRNPGQGYCRVVIAPKLTALRSRHQALLRT
jgi:peptide-methionine (S)-S-oxide reductase